ncbi:hypothetical protein D3C71_2087710 [compost metagenome]
MGNTVVRTYTLKVVMDLDHLDDLIRLLWNLGYFHKSTYNPQSRIEQTSNPLDTLEQLLNEQGSVSMDETTSERIREVINYLKQNQE